MRLLFVCTGNICRSPLAERLVRAWVNEVAHTAVQASSAGICATSGARMDVRAADVLRRLGGDPTGFAARPLTEDIALDAELVLTMTRKQRTHVLGTTPRGLRRTFTLLEAASLLELADLDRLPQGSQRAVELGLRLDAARRFRSTTKADDVPDPIGLSASAHRQIGGGIADALRPLAEVLLDTTLASRPSAGARPTHNHHAPAVRRADQASATA